ncbi:MAG: BlaI/MecI/CopY family transcriptional regulator [Bacteroidia bacterium]|nr:BlaI/MecI/CopY family transcriptional regulator [Bacteroidia bacterium]
MSLTTAEEQLMKYLWKLEKSFFKQLKEQYPDPKPATTTINTLLKRLKEKGYVDYKLFGNSREYFPLVSRNEYFSDHLKVVIKNFFNNSVEQFGSFFTKEMDISHEELLSLKKIVDDKLNSESDD